MFGTLKSLLRRCLDVQTPILTRYLDVWGFVEQLEPVKVSSWPKPLHHFLSSLSMWCRQSKELLLRLVRRRKKKYVHNDRIKGVFWEFLEPDGPGSHLSFVLPLKEGLFQLKQGTFGFQVCMFIYLLVIYLLLFENGWWSKQTFPTNLVGIMLGIFTQCHAFETVFFGSSGWDFFGSTKTSDERQPWWDFSKENAWHGHEKPGVPPTVVGVSWGFWCRVETETLETGQSFARSGVHEEVRL